MNLPRIPEDKANHFIYGLGIFAVLFLSCFFFVKLQAAVSIATLATISVGIIREPYQRHTGIGTYDLYDALATTLGGLSGALMVFLPTLLQQPHSFPA